MFDKIGASAVAKLCRVYFESVHVIVVQSHDDGQELFEAVKRLGLEGIVSKKKGSRFTLGHRSEHWIKVKNYQFATVAINGIRKNEFGWNLQLPDGIYVGVCEFVPAEARSAFFQIIVWRGVVFHSKPF